MPHVRDRENPVNPRIIQADGQVENIHKTLKSMLKARVEEKPESWDKHLDYCMMASRSSGHASTGHIHLN